MSLLTQAEIDRRMAALDSNTLKARAADLGCTWDGAGLLLPFYGHSYRVSPRGMHALNESAPGPIVSGILLDYVGAGPLVARATEEQITFRELPGAGPLVIAFANNTHKILAQSFGNNLARLTSACEHLKGHIDTTGTGFDLAVDFIALPRVPIRLQFNAADDLFPAEAGLLFKVDASDYLGLHSLFALATYLTGSLISFESA